MGVNPAIGMSMAMGLLAYCLARYGDGVLGFFFLDDFWLLRTARSIELGSRTALWAILEPQHAGFGLYRPLTQTGYFYALRQLFALDATGYHAVQLGFFFANTVLVLAIVRRLTASWSRAAAAAILYAAAPGHAVAVYWLAAFTMIGTAFVTFAAMLWWLTTDGWVRAVGCGILQVIALLCSEHAIVLPVLLCLVGLFGSRAMMPTLWRQLAPATAVAGGYLAAKLVYFVRVGPPTGSYAMQPDVNASLEHIGRYAAATLNATTLAGIEGASAMTLGIVMVVALTVTALLAARGYPRWRTSALGLGIFVTALLPVLPLTGHYYDYYIGVAAVGVAIAIIGLCDQLPGWSGGLAVLIAAVVVVVDLRTCDRAVVNSPTLRDVVSGQQAAADLILSLGITQRVAGFQTGVTVARSPITDSVIDAGAAHQVFFTPPVLVTVIGGTTSSSLLADPTIPSVPLYRAPPQEAPFWWIPSLAWVRESVTTPARWYWSACEDFSTVGASD
ncbi:MAG: hypothetical protein ACRERC_06790 [Candidatus Binatia bacterium]